MTLPANIRVNMSAPFPSKVKGSGPITIAKKNGVWTVGFSFLQLGTQIPPFANLNTDYLIFYDSLVDTVFRAPLTSLASTALAARTQRSVTAGPVAIAGNDQILNLNLGASLTITLPSYLVRSGVPLTFKDVGKQATAHPILIAALAGEFIDGMASIPLNVAGQGLTLVPANDGVNTGWSIQ